MTAVEALPPERPIHGQMVLLPGSCAAGAGGRHGEGHRPGQDRAEPGVLVVSRAVVTSGSLVFQPSDVHLAIEVVSPGRTTKDRELRPVQCASVGIKCFWRVENEDDAMVVYTFELLPEGGYASTGVFRGRVKVDRPFPIDIDLPEVTWLSLPAELGPVQVRMDR